MTLKKIALSAISLVVVSCGTTPTRQEVSPPSPASAVLHDTVVVVDSTALQALSRREKRLSERLSTTMELLRSYVTGENQLNAAISALRDSVEQLSHQQQQITTENHQNQSLAAEVAELENQLWQLRDSMALMAVTATPVVTVEVAPIGNSKKAADTIALLEEKAIWLASQPRRIYTIGAEDNVSEVEVTNAYRFGNYLFIALSSPGDITAAQLNGVLPVVAKNGVCVYAYPTSPKVLIEAAADGRQYAIKTTTKKLR